MSDLRSSDSAVEATTTSSPRPIDVQQRVVSLRFEKVPASGLLRVGPLVFVVALGLLAYFAATRFRGELENESALSQSNADANWVSIPPRGPSDAVLQASGVIAVRSKVQINSRVRGIIETLGIEEGQVVQQGELLAEVDDTAYRADVAEAKALLALSRARLVQLQRGSRPEEIQQARATLQKALHRQSYLGNQRQRLSELMSRNAASQQDYEQAESSSLEADAQVDELQATLRLVELGARKELIDAAAAEVERSEALLRKAEYYLDSTRIVAPVDGVVLEKSAELGQRIGLELGPSQVCVIAQQGDMEAVIDIHERDLHLIRLGQPCVIRADSRPQHEFQGTLAWLSPLLDHQRSIREAKVRFTSPPDWLLPNMNCRVEFLPSRETEGDAANRIDEQRAKRTAEVNADQDSSRPLN